MNRIGVLVAVLFIQLLLPSAQTISSEALDPSARKTESNEPNVPSRDVKALKGELAYTAIREAIFGDRQQLLSYLGDRRSHAPLCTPALKETYELFQAALKQELEVLWDLQDNASQYRLSKKELKDVKACITKMEEFDENFPAWQELNEAQEQK